MNTIVNISDVTDYSGETPVVTYSNPVTTVIIRPPRVRVTERIFCCQNGCNCCGGCGCCNNQCRCN